MLATILELLSAFGLIFGMVIVFSQGMEWLTNTFSQAGIIFGFSMLIPLALLERYLQKGSLCFTAQEKKSIWGAVSFILFFVFFALAAIDLKDLGLDSLGLPSALLGLVAMFMAMRQVENLNIPKKFNHDPEMMTDKTPDDNDKGELP